MKPKIRKIIGWLLIIIGLVVIFWSLYASYNIFTAKEKAPEVFKTEEKELISEQYGSEDEARALIDEQLKEILPANFGSQLFNLVAWSIFMAILILAGGKITAIGIKLIGD